jgi:hypothetical protein
VRRLALQLVHMLPHERLEAYWLAEEYVAFIDYLLPRIKTGSRHDADQLDRSGGSLVLNFIEAASDNHRATKFVSFATPGAKFFRNEKLKSKCRMSFVRLTLQRALQCLSP